MQAPFSIAAFSIAVLAGNLHAEFGMPCVFSDGAVLQCDKPLPIWGWGDPGTSVSVTFGGQTETTQIASDGCWMVKLDPIEASCNEQTLSVKADDDTRAFRAIVMGEVWLCMGQSNMESTLSAMARRTRDAGYESVVKFMADEIRNANDPYLRHVKIPKRAVFSAGERDFEGEWQSSSNQGIGEFSAAAYFFGKELRKHLNRPVGLLNASWGAQRIDPFVPPSAWKGSSRFAGGYANTLPSFEARKANYNPVAAKNAYKQAMQKWENGGKRGREPWMNGRPTLDAPVYPGTIFNGMIHPLVPYAIKGVIWYQGESHNQNRAHEYGAKLELLVAGIRNEWRTEDLPFYFCQLANHRVSETEPITQKSNWVTVSNQIRLVSSKVPHAGMAVLNDVGQTGDIHPRNKYDVGVRLSKWALHNDYGFGKVVPAGPLYKSHETKGNSIIINFDHAGSGLMTAKKELLEPTAESHEPLGGFQICGADRVWKWAMAKVVGCDQVQVSHQEVASPVGVRYAWQSNPVSSNLYNKEGLPAGLFSTVELKD